jgi:hypothetical protein
VRQAGERTVSAPPVYSDPAVHLMTCSSSALRARPFVSSSRFDRYESGHLPDSICFSTSRYGFSIVVSRVCFQDAAVRLKPVPGNQDGRYFTTRFPSSATFHSETPIWTGCTDRMEPYQQSKPPAFLPQRSSPMIHSRGPRGDLSHAARYHTRMRSSGSRPRFH